MKKRILLVVSLLCALCMLSGCAMLNMNQMESMFRREAQEETQNPAIFGTNDSDTVTITREDYERLEQFSELADLIDIAEEAYYEDTDRAKMIEGAAKGLMSALGDPYTYYYNPEEWQEMWEDDEGNYTGIGVLISANYQTQICTISRVFKGSPAEMVGVQRGDILYRVGEDLYVNANNLSDAVDIMRGLPDTDVDVTFLRNGEEITFTITRKMISVNQVESKMLTDDVGYIALYQFAGEAEKEFEKDLNKLIEDGAKGIIMDLRDNPGGWVEQARYIADLFLDRGELCYLVYKNGKEDHTEYLTRNGKVDVKLVVMMNENSASSSEILAGALQDRAEATVVGTQSFGKGIIQAVNEIGKNGAGFQMTIASYYTPNGNAVHKVGIKPDVECSIPEGDNGMYEFADLENDVQLIKALEVIQEKLK
ncbi:MAG: S41 family peptidase [Clostridia bacterium]|nr:S41 family peptidase [Clostridia bacterium]